MVERNSWNGSYTISVPDTANRGGAHLVVDAELPGATANCLFTVSRLGGYSMVQRSKTFQ